MKEKELRKLEELEKKLDQIIEYLKINDPPRRTNRDLEHIARKTVLDFRKKHGQDNEHGDQKKSAQ